jgi:post-segregation antitoxin (ccd killing protein)
MTNRTTVVSVKIPARILERIPAAGQGRSRFIVRALEKEIERQRPTEWQPTTRRGRKFAKLLEAGKAERGPLMTEEEFNCELRERRGRNF